MVETITPNNDVKRKNNTQSFPSGKLFLLARKNKLLYTQKKHLNKIKEGKMSWGEFLWENIQAAKKGNPKIELFHYRDKKSGNTFEIGFKEIEEHSIVLTHLRITAQEHFTIRSLEQAVRYIEDDIIYLEESFALIEATPYQINLRSKKPFSNKAQKEFYEITITKNSAFLQRWRYQEKTKQPIPFTLTRGIFVRLINDFTFALNII